MKVITNYIELSTDGKFDILDITDQVLQNLRLTLFREGNVTVFNPGATAGISTMEYDASLVSDFQKTFEKLVPDSEQFEHDSKWQKDNGHAYLRSLLMKSSLTVPFRQSKLLLGTLQKIVFVEFDNRPRQRKIITQFIGT